MTETHIQSLTVFFCHTNIAFKIPFHFYLLSPSFCYSGQSFFSPRFSPSTNARPCWLRSHLPRECHLGWSTKKSWPNIRRRVLRLSGVAPQCWFFWPIVLFHNVFPVDKHRILVPVKGDRSGVLSGVVVPCVAG